VNLLPSLRGARSPAVAQREGGSDAELLIASLALAMAQNMPLHLAANIGQMRSNPSVETRFHGAE